MSLDKIKHLLEERIGLNPDSVGEYSIKRAIGQRQNKLELKTSAEYFKLLSASATEINELVEDVVVPETWFFRNKVPFRTLSDYVGTTLIPSLKKDDVIRILSIPCSTGEEPYSIAISLLNNGVPASRIKIDAVDISKRAITKARRAIYGKNSFREVEDEIGLKYFNKIQSGQKLDDKVKNVVEYRQGNILVGSIGLHPGYYDIVFCRNLLIYFNRDIQKIALDKLHRALKAGGVLFVGHVETSQMPRSKFKKYGPSKSFSYLKLSGTLESNESTLDVLSGITAKPPADTGISSKKDEEKIKTLRNNRPAKTKKKVTKKKVSSRKNKTILREIEKLEHKQKYSEAVSQCEDFLQDVPDSAEGFYLLGLIHHSMGDNKKSESLLKKAVYLDPNHENAMTLSLLLAELRDDKAAIESFTRRISRISMRNDT